MVISTVCSNRRQEYSTVFIINLFMLNPNVNSYNLSYRSPNDNINIFTSPEVLHCFMNILCCA